MNKQTKYYVLIKYTILSLVLTILLGYVSRTLQSWDLFHPDIINPIYDLIGVLKVLLVIATILGAITLLYLMYNYYTSKFYRDYQLNALEGIYHGFIDIYQVYDKLHNSGKAQNIQVDFKKSTIYFDTQNGYYCFNFIDLFGRIEGKQDSEFWEAVSKPKTRYNQKVYTKRVKFLNPYKANQEYVKLLQSKTSKPYQNYVVISGFYNMKYKPEHILAPYEILDFIK